MPSSNDYPYSELGDQNVEIGGFPFYAESINSNESYSRRDLKRTKIMNGAEVVTQGDFIPRDYSFTSKLQIEKDRHDMYDEVFQILISSPQEVVCRDMGPIFDAQVTIKKQPITGDPYNIQVEVQVVEIVDTSSYFPDFVTQSDIITITNGVATKEELALLNNTSTNEDEE